MAKYRIEIMHNEKDNINIEGCKSIEKYSEDKIILSLCDRKLIITGKKLTMPILFKENLCICGFVKSISTETERENL